MVLEVGPPVDSKLDQIRETLGSDHPIAVGDQLDDAFPVDPPIQTNAHPAPRSDIGRHKKLQGVGLYQYFLSSWRCFAPEREATIPVVIVHVHREVFLANPKGYMLAERFLRRLWKREADFSQADECVASH